MNINLIYRHPCELEIESLLSREEPYPDTFTLADHEYQLNLSSSV
nr:MAG TPA: hypothetical protein [Caudoviricetes sp.]